MTPKNLSGGRIKEARARVNLDQVELAAALEIEHGIKLDQSDISEIERQVRGVKDTELNAIAIVLDVSPTWLLRGGDE